MPTALERDWANAQHEIADALAQWGDSRARQVQSRYLKPLSDSSAALLQGLGRHEQELSGVEQVVRTLAPELTRLQREADEVERGLQRVERLGRDLERQNDRARDRVADAERVVEDAERLLSRIHAVRL